MQVAMCVSGCAPCLPNKRHRRPIAEQAAQQADTNEEFEVVDTQVLESKLYWQGDYQSWTSKGGPSGTTASET